MAKESAIAGVSVIPRGTELKCVDPAAHACKYTTAYDVKIGPYRISGTRFAPIVQAPAASGLSSDVTSQIEIEILCTSVSTGLAQLGLDKIRVYIAGEPSFGATLRDALFMRTVSTYVEADGSGVWTALDQTPLSAVGFADDDAMIPSTPSDHPVYRLLTEYFSYPAKFRFLDIHLTGLSRHLPPGCRRVTLHFALAGVPANSNVARILKRLSTDNLLLGCTPVINLFKTHATPIRLTQERSEYPLLPYESPVENYEIYSVDSVQLLRKSAKGSVTTDFTPYYSLRHGGSAGAKPYSYLVHRDEDLAEMSPGHEYTMAFVDGEFSPLVAATGTASVALTCTNRTLPCSLPYGASGGDLAIEGGAGNFPIRLLFKPTAPHRLTSANGAQWGLISSLSLNHRSLSSEGLQAFVAMLELCAPSDCAVAQRSTEGSVDLFHRSTRAWLPDSGGAAYLSGFEVSVTLDEDACAGCGVHTFIQLLDHFFALYVHLNSFTQLVVLSKSTGKELLRCLPRNGAWSLV